jgi:hypothetical protein
VNSVACRDTGYEHKVSRIGLGLKIPAIGLVPELWTDAVSSVGIVNSRYRRPTTTHEGSTIIRVRVSSQVQTLIAACMTRLTVLVLIS